MHSSNSNYTEVMLLCFSSYIFWPKSHNLLKKVFFAIKLLIKLICSKRSLISKYNNVYFLNCLYCRISDDIVAALHIKYFLNQMEQFYLLVLSKFHISWNYFKPCRTKWHNHNAMYIIDTLCLVGLHFLLHFRCKLLQWCYIS